MSVKSKTVFFFSFLFPFSASENLRADTTPNASRVRAWRAGSCVPSAGDSVNDLGVCGTAFRCAGGRGRHREAFNKLLPSRTRSTQCESGNSTFRRRRFGGVARSIPQTGSCLLFPTSTPFLSRTRAPNNVARNQRVTRAFRNPPRPHPSRP